MKADSSSLFNSSRSTASDFNEQPPVFIRAARLEDIPTLASILTDSFHPPRGLMYFMYPVYRLGVCEDLRGRLRSRSSHYNCLVAIACLGTPEVQNNVIVGTVELSVRSGYSAYADRPASGPYIANLAVDSSYRRKGIARKLLLKCEQVARNWGFSELSLHVLEDNDRARKLYLTSGYQLISAESGFGNWFFNNPKRLLLSKKIKDRS
ncbi:MAG: GNAT family N-acetyltransferase [Prochloraceae cyanobacterium]